MRNNINISGILFLIFFLIWHSACTEKERQATQTSDVKGDIEIGKPVEPVIITDGPGPYNIYINVDEQPEFPGGQTALLEFIRKTLSYPLEAKVKNIQGRVICMFVVERDGSLSDIQVVRGVDPSLDKEAIRIIEAMPNWEPAKVEKQPVRSRYTLPMAFTLGEKSDNSGNTDIRTEDD